MWKLAVASPEIQLIVLIFSSIFIVDMNNLSYQLVMQVMHKLYVLQ